MYDAHDPLNDLSKNCLAKGKQILAFHTEIAIGKRSYVFPKKNKTNVSKLNVHTSELLHAAYLGLTLMLVRMNTLLEGSLQSVDLRKRRL